MPVQVLIPIADGCEESEAVIMIDTLRRSGAEVVVASCNPNNNLTVIALHQCKITADVPIDSCADKSFHLIALPGGMPGAENLKNCSTLIDLLHKQRENNQWYAAICAAPAVVLASHGLLDNTYATCYPTFIDQMDGALPSSGGPVVVDSKKRVITAQGPGNAMGFAFRLIDALYGKDAFRPIAKQMLADWAL